MSFISFWYLVSDNNTLALSQSMKLFCSTVEFRFYTAAESGLRLVCNLQDLRERRHV